MPRIDQPNGCRLDNHMVIGDPEPPDDGTVRCEECEEVLEEDFAIWVDGYPYCDICAAELEDDGSDGEGGEDE